MSQEHTQFNVAPVEQTQDVSAPTAAAAEPAAAVGLNVAPVAPVEQPSDAGPMDGAPLMDEPRVLVIGVGGAGGNAVNTMIRRRLEGVEYLAANTDAQALAGSLAQTRLQLGLELTRGLGAGGKPDMGRKSAEESDETIREALAGAHMCFIAAGMGGGTGTGAAPCIARIARELGVLTVGVVSKPFDFEGPRRRAIAEEGVVALAKELDTIIVIPNQNLFRVATESTTFTDAFQMADEVLYQGVKGVTDLMFRPGLVNLDFSDVRAVIDGMGSAMMGSGEAEGEDRARLAAERAVDNPLLDDVTLRGAKGVLINITGGPDMKLFEVDAAASRVRMDADEDADVFFGSTIDPEMEGRIRVSVVATGVLRRPEAELAAGHAAQRSEPAQAAPTPVQSTVAAEVAAQTVPSPIAAAPAVETAGAETPAVAATAAVPATPAAAPIAGEAAAPVANAPVAEPAQAAADTASAAQAEQASEPTNASASRQTFGSAASRSDELVRKMTATMVRNVDSSAEKVSSAVSDSAKPAAMSEPRKPAVTPTRAVNRPARENGRLEIPSFLRRQPQ